MYPLDEIRMHRVLVVTRGGAALLTRLREPTSIFVSQAGNAFVALNVLILKTTC